MMGQKTGSCRRTSGDRKYGSRKGSFASDA